MGTVYHRFLGCLSQVLGYHRFLTVYHRLGNVYHRLRNISYRLRNVCHRLRYWKFDSWCSMRRGSVNFVGWDLTGRYRP